MKSFASIILLLTMTVLVTPHTIKDLVEECKATVPMSEELEKSFLELKFPPEEKTAHCLLECIGRTLKVLDEKSGINLGVITTLLQSVEPEGVVSEEQVKCVAEAAQKKKDHEGEEQDDDQCLMAFKLYECFEKEFVALMKLNEE
ncbi:uncharacterized protein LOC134223708 [Armigeres subalbatus]|uniref:uncharacterized protein LOC134223708 n=1 Tax=Armigeres subalbatus TaxID=124917 RepID=UPI002ED1AB40